MSIQIYIMTHKPFKPPKDPLFIPLQVGRANAEDLGYLGDHTGDTISAQNQNFCELTGMYWIWKNKMTSDYIGICHYRRFLIDEQEQLLTGTKLASLLEKYDIITTKLLTLPGSYYDGFCENHHKKDLDSVGDVIHQMYPEYDSIFKKMVHGTHTYFGNIFITTREIYDQYCTWLFSILFEVQKHVDYTGYNNYQKRLFGFLAEFLQTVYIEFHQYKTLECKVGMLGEKYETRQLKNKLAEYFLRKDYLGAQQYFMTSYQNRPDILMQASDTTGELRLCMQIISTCEYEMDELHSCILDKINQYQPLIHRFEMLNQTIQHFINNQTDSSDYAFLKDADWLTKPAVEVSLRIFCNDAMKRQQLAKKIQSFLE